MPTHVLLVTVVAEALTTVFQHLSQREAMIWPHGCPWGCCACCCHASSGRCKQRWSSSWGRSRLLLVWGKGWPWGRAGAALLRDCCRSQRPFLEGASEELEVRRGARASRR